MRIFRSINRANRAALALALAALMVAFTSLIAAQPAPAAELTGASVLTTQDTAGGTRILKGMVSFKDSKPFTAGAYDEVPKVVNGDATLSASYYDWKLTSGDGDSASKVWTITGKTSGSTVYYGVVRVSYSISDQSTSPEAGDNAADGQDAAEGDGQSSEEAAETQERVALATNDNIDIEYKDSALVVTPADAVKEFVEVEEDEEAGTIAVVGKEDTKLEGQKVVVSYAVEEGCEITRDMIDIAWLEEGMEPADGEQGEDEPDGAEAPISDIDRVLVAVFDDGRSDEVKDLEPDKHFALEITSAGHVESGDFDLSEGEFCIHVKGIAPYSGDFEVFGVFDDVEADDGATHKFFSDKQPLKGSMVTLDANAFAYDGAIHVPTVTARLDTAILTAGEHYELAYENDKSATVTPGGYKLTVTGKPSGGYVGTVTKSYDILGKAFDYVADIADNSPRKPTYTGSAIYPTIKIKKKDDGDDSWTTLSSGATNANYEIVWPDDMTNAGKKTISVKVKGADDEPDLLVAVDNDGEDSNPFEIAQASLSDATVTVSTSPTITYTGEALEPAVTVTWKPSGGNTVTLVKDVDYTATYTNNIDAKAASDSTNPPTVTVAGLESGNFKDQKGQTFTINTKSISGAEVGSIDNQVYTGAALTPVPTVTVDDKVLEYGKDFTVTYYSNTSVGTAYGYIYGAGNYGSSKYVYPMFAIVGRPISDVTVASIGTETYTGYSVQPRPTITYKGETLTQGTDYTLSYENNIDPGTATMTISGRSTFAGTKTVKFTIGSTGAIPNVNAKNMGNGTVLLSWSPIYKATKYMISEKKTDGSYRVLSDNCLSTACTISNLSVTRNHRFLVRAYVGGSWSSKSEKLLVSVKPTGAKKPTVRAFSSTKTAVLLSWNSVPGADRYAIYEKVGGTFQMRTDSYTATNAPVTQLRPKGKYTFYVKAHVDGKWSKVKKSDYVTISPADPNPPSVVASTGVGKGKVKLTWGKARNAKKYMVQVKTGKGKWKTLTKKCKKTTYTAKKLSPEKTYTFRVRAFGNGKWSKAYSEYYVTATPDAA